MTTPAGSVPGGSIGSVDGGNREQQVLDLLASLTLFSDLSHAELETVVHTFAEEWHAAGERVIRQGFAGTGFYVILEGEVSVRVDAEERARLGRGEFFGEVSVLLGDTPVADIVALTALRCLQLPGPLVEQFLVDHPRVAWRMLQAEARRLRNANRWRS